jgi:hypothetical protein
LAGGFLDYVKRGLLEITVLHVIGSTQAPPASHYRCFAELKVYRFLLEYDAERSGSFQPLRFVSRGRMRDRLLLPPHRYDALERSCSQAEGVAFASEQTMLQATAKAHPSTRELFRLTLTSSEPVAPSIAPSLFFILDHHAI